MGTVLVHLDSFHFLCVNITADMITLVDHQAGLAFLGGFMGKYSSKKSGSYDQIIIFLHLVLPLSVWELQNSSACVWSNTII